MRDFVIKTQRKSHSMIWNVRRPCATMKASRFISIFDAMQHAAICYCLPDDCERIFLTFRPRSSFLVLKLRLADGEAMLRYKQMSAFKSHSSFCCEWNSSWNIQILIWDAITLCTLINEYNYNSIRKSNTCYWFRSVFFVWTCVCNAVNSPNAYQNTYDV